MIADLLMKVARDLQPPDQEYRPRPSGYGRCIRAAVYHALGYPAAPWAGRFVILLEDSGFSEDMTIDWINRTAYKVHSQQMEVVLGTTAGGDPIKGHIDGIIEDLLGYEFVFDHKGLNCYSFERMEAALMDGEWDETAVKYLYQGVGYLNSEIIKQAGIDAFMLLVKNKNTSAYLEILTRYDAGADTLTITHALSTRISEKSEDGIYGQIDAAKGMTLPNVFGNFMGYFNAIEYWTSRKTLPPRPYEMSSWQCSYCRFQAECWKGYEAEVEAMQEGVEMPAEIEPLAQEYRTLTDTESACRKRKKELKAELLKEMGARKIQKCKSASGLSMALSVEGRSTVDPDLIPAEVRSRASKRTEWQEVQVRAPRKGKGE
jgi:hypothetical protein